MGDPTWLFYHMIGDENAPAALASAKDRLRFGPAVLKALCRDVMQPLLEKNIRLTSARQMVLFDRICYNDIDEPTTNDPCDCKRRRCQSFNKCQLDLILSFQFDREQKSILYR
jgi:hypothetical protein